MADQAERLRQMMMTGQTVDEFADSAGGGRVIAVASGKGGVGKSNFCINFALALQKAGHRPIVIDTDLGFANVEVLLGVRPSGTILDVLSGASIWELIEHSTSGLPFLSAGNGLNDLHSFSARQVDRLLEQMQQLHQKFDVVIIDSGAGLGANHGRLLSAADDLVVVTTPEPTAIADAYALLKLLAARTGVPPAYLVVNRVHGFAEGKAAAEKLCMVTERFLNVRLQVMGYVLEDDNVVQAVMKQQALFTSFPKSPAARCYSELVDSYLKGQSSQKRRGMAGVIERMMRRLRPGGGVDSTHPA